MIVSRGCTFNLVPAWRRNTFVSHLSAIPVETTFRIRDSQYADLAVVSDIIIRSFYANVTSPWNHMYRMAELNRLQQGFPYADKELHRMLVAVSIIDDTVIGFCDIDARVPNRPTGYKYNPRPYLSDICVDPDWRRRGIARSLIEACESFCSESLDREEVFIRVEKENHAALHMYRSMEYYRVKNPDDPLGSVILLKKNLTVAPNVVVGDGETCAENNEVVNIA